MAIGVLDDNEEGLVALDPGTGEVLWETDDVEDPGSDLVPVLGFGETGVVVGLDRESLLAFETGTGEVAWTVELDDADYVTSVPQSVLVNDGDVLSAFEVSSGEQQWSYEAPDNEGIHVSADGTRVLVAGDEDLILLDAATGDEVWRVAEVWPGDLGRYNLDYGGEEFGATSAQGVAGTGPLVQRAYADDTVVVASLDDDGDLFAVDPASGREMWLVESSDHSGFGLLGWENSVVSVGRDGVAAWDKTTGAQLWELDLDLGSGSGDSGTSESAETGNDPDLVQHGQILLIADPEVGLVAVDLADGTQAWQRTMDDLESLSTAGDHVVVVIDGVPTALDPLTGQVSWRGEAGEDPEDTKLVVLRDTTDGVVLDVASSNALDLETGEVLWTLEGQDE